MTLKFLFVPGNYLFPQLTQQTRGNHPFTRFPLLHVDYCQITYHSSFSHCFGTICSNEWKVTIGIYQLFIHLFIHAVPPKRTQIPCNVLKINLNISIGAAGGVLGPRLCRGWPSKARQGISAGDAWGGARKHESRRCAPESEARWESSY